jgi:hypothetical protein
MDEAQAIAETVRQACIEAALRAYEEGGISGLCAEGRWELAVDALRRLDLQALLQPPR